MRVRIEVTPLRARERTGIATYLDRLCRALLTEAQPTDDIVFYSPGALADPFADIAAKDLDARHVLSRELYRALSNWRWPREIPADVDVYHLPYPARAATRRTESTAYVTTIYDLAFARYPETITEPGTFRFLADCLPEQAMEADAVVTLSESCRTDICTIIGAGPAKVHVVYPGVDLKPPPHADGAANAAALRALGVPEQYLLCVGTWEPRKNLPTLLEAVHRLRATLQYCGVRLCLAGKRGWKYDEADRVIESLSLQDLVVALDYVPRDVLPALYAGARAFVYPSLYEGFGLPVLEAMACGAPVVASRSSSIPEAAGDAAVLVDPHSPDELADGIAGFLEDDAARDAYRARGFEQAARFSWQRAAGEMLAVYRAAHADRSAARAAARGMPQ
jgi:glycosyltransferase involved in cell wall biosynthesis